MSDSFCLVRLYIQDWHFEKFQAGLVPDEYMHTIFCKSLYRVDETVVSLNNLGMHENMYCISCMQSPHDSLPLKATSAFMFFLVQSAHLARPTTTDATWASAAFVTAIAISTAQTPRNILPDAMVLLASYCKC